MSPDVAFVQTLKPSIFSARPEDDAYLQIAGIEEVILVGSKAASQTGRKADGAKSATAALKALAAIGVAVEYLGLDSEFCLSLSGVLPLAEYMDADNFKALLTSQLHTGFEFRGKPINCTVEMLDILPEGGELALHYRSRTPVLDERKDIREFDKARTLIVQWGHRDLSLLPFEMGRFSDTKADGSKLGFSIFMEQVIEAAALNLKPHELLELPRLLFASKSNPQLLRQIARMAIGSGSGLNRQKELEEKVCQIENAIAQATAEYLEMIFSHIVGQLTLNAYDTILLSGGSSLYFCEIEELLQIEAPGAKVFIDEDLVAEIATQISGINEVDAYRAADAYGIMLRLLNKVQQQAEKVEKKSSPRLPNLADSKRQSKSSARVQ